MALSGLLAAGFVQRNTRLFVIAFKLAFDDAGAVPASSGPSLKATAQNPKLRRTEPAASRADMATRTIPRLVGHLQAVVRGRTRLRLMMELPAVARPSAAVQRSVAVVTYADSESSP